MPPISSRPRVSDLSFQVFARTIHPDWFAVKSHRRIAHAGWVVDLRILSGGHAVQWLSNGFSMTEALTGPETALPEPGLLFHFSLRHERSARVQPGGGLEYQMSFEVERCDAEIFAHLCNEATLDASRNSLSASFSSDNRLEPPSLSLIQFEARARGLSVHTFRSFPAERAIVRTHSLFELQMAIPTR